MEVYLTLALLYMLWDNWSLTQDIAQLRYNQRNYIEMLKQTSDSLDEKP